ncbi:MAG: hypothetical protein OEV44_02805 [Spirochaetota bacterium]|nr:hypothetical protein [Spirochaetota bacterium]
MKADVVLNLWGIDEACIIYVHDYKIGSTGILYDIGFSIATEDGEIIKDEHLSSEQRAECIEEVLQHYMNNKDNYS